MSKSDTSDLPLLAAIVAGLSVWACLLAVALGWTHDLHVRSFIENPRDPAAAREARAVRNRATAANFRAQAAEYRRLATQARRRDVANELLSQAKQHDDLAASVGSLMPAMGR